MQSENFPIGVHTAEKFILRSSIQLTELGLSFVNEVVVFNVSYLHENKTLVKAKANSSFFHDNLLINDTNN